MSQRDIFSVLDDGQSYKVEPKTLRRDRKILKKAKKTETEKVARKKKEESENIEPDVDFTKD